MKYIATYSFWGVLLLMILMIIVNKLQLSDKLTNALFMIAGIILFTILGALLKAKVRISSAESTARKEN